MADFATYITGERERLGSAILDIDTQINELGSRRADLQREMKAIDAYEAAKTGKAVTAKTGGTTRRARRGSRREEIVQLVRDTGPITRGELIERLGVKGDKSGEMSISNALSALLKTNQLGRDPQMPSRYVFQNAA